MKIICLIFTLLVSPCNQLNKKSKSEEGIDSEQIANQKKIIQPVSNTQTIELNNDSGLQNADTNIIELKNLKYFLLDIKSYDIDKRELLIVKDKIKKYQIKILTPDEAQGFSVNWIKDIGSGFEISIEYGSRYYFQKDFQFIFENNSFYLRKIITNSFDKNKAGKYKKDTKVLDKPINITNFKIEDYI